MKIITIVVSVFNEQEGIIHFSNDLFKTLSQIHNYKFEVLWVNDGSTDKSHLIIQREIISQFHGNIINKYIRFSKNFGHESAMLAGIDNSSGEVLICIDSDMQHPPSLIRKMLEIYEEGYEIVLPKRISNPDQSLIKNFVNYIFYKIINSLSEQIKLEEGVSDFFLISKDVIELFKHEYRFSARWIRGVIQSIGFSVTKVEYRAESRKYGNSKYDYRKLMSLSLDAIFSFSFKPMHVAKYISLIFIFLSISLGVYSFFEYFSGHNPPSGYTTIILFISLSFSLLFFILAIICFYIEKLIRETYKYPLYIIKSNSDENK